MTTAKLPDLDAIRVGLGNKLSDIVDVHVFDKLESTSTWLRSHRHSFDESLDAGRSQLCITDWQQAGVGRRGKSWQTQPGNVTFSILTRVRAPAHQLLGLSLVTGIAVSEQLENQFSLDVMLKWPNDLIHDDRKLGGLLTELVSVTEPPGSNSTDACENSAEKSGKGTSTDVITGIGININHDAQMLGLGIGATSMNQAGIAVLQAERDALIGSLCANVLAAHDRFLRLQWASFATAWIKRDWLAGRNVTVQRGDTAEQAIARGVNEQGALLVESAGKILPLYGGNVSIRPTI